MPTSATSRAEWHGRPPYPPHAYESPYPPPRDPYPTYGGYPPSRAGPPDPYWMHHYSGSRSWEEPEAPRWRSPPPNRRRDFLPPPLAPSQSWPEPPTNSPKDREDEDTDDDSKKDGDPLALLAKVSSDMEGDKKSIQPPTSPLQRTTATLTPSRAPPRSSGPKPITPTSAYGPPPPHYRGPHGPPPPGYYGPPPPPPHWDHRHPPIVEGGSFESGSSERPPYYYYDAPPPPPPPHYPDWGPRYHRFPAPPPPYYPRPPPPPSQAYSYVQQPSLQEKTILRKKFSWKHYPELERFLISNRDDYLKHSSQNYTAEQKQYNNWLTEQLLEVAERHNYIFDPEDFNFVAIRDRIRCYYKSYVQTARKRGLPLPPKQVKDESTEAKEEKAEAPQEG